MVTYPTFPPPSSPPPSMQPSVTQQPNADARLTFITTLGLAVGLWAIMLISFVISVANDFGTLSLYSVIYSSFSSSLLIGLALVLSTSLVAHWTAVGVTGLYTIGVIVMSFAGMTMGMGFASSTSMFVYLIPMLVGLAGAVLAALRSMQAGSARGLGAMSRWIPIAIAASASIIGQLVYLVSSLGQEHSSALIFAWVPSFIVTIALVAVVCLPAIGAKWTPFAAGGIAVLVGLSQIGSMATALISAYATAAMVVPFVLRLLLYFAVAAMLIWIGVKRVRDGRPQHGSPSGWQTTGFVQPGQPPVQNPYSQQH